MSQVAKDLDLTDFETGQVSKSLGDIYHDFMLSTVKYSSIPQEYGSGLLLVTTLTIHYYLWKANTIILNMQVHWSWHNNAIIMCVLHS